MDILIDWREYKTEFKDKEVVVELKPLSVGEVQSIAPFLQYDEKEEQIATQIKMYNLQKSSADILKAHVKNIKADFTVGGEPLTVEHIAGLPVLTALAVELIGELSTISMLTDADRKKSKPLSAKPEQETA